MRDLFYFGRIAKHFKVKIKILKEVFGKNEHHSLLILFALISVSLRFFICPLLPQVVSVQLSVSSFARMFSRGILKPHNFD